VKKEKGKAEEKPEPTETEKRNEKKKKKKPKGISSTKEQPKCGGGEKLYRYVDRKTLHRRGGGDVGGRRRIKGSLAKYVQNFRMKRGIAKERGGANKG